MPSFTLVGLALPLLFSFIAADVPTGFKQEALLKNMNNALDMEFLPDGRAIIVQREGQVFWVDFSKLPYTLNEYFTMSRKELHTDGETGIMDICLAPDFATAPANAKYVYVYFGKEAAGNFRISRFNHYDTGSNIYLDLNTEFTVWQDVDGFPGPYHFGGQISFGPDGAIYLSQGDKTMDNWAQDMKKYAGKVIRVNPDGSFPADNLGVRTPGALPGIYMLGVRNGYRSAWDLVKERFYLWVVGGNDQRTAWESIFLGGKDLNLGWPLCEGYCDPANPNPDFKQCNCQKHTSPIYSYPHLKENACIIGGVMYRASAYPSEYQETMFIADYSRQWIKYLKFDDSGTKVVSENTFSADCGLQLINIKLGPDGYIYYQSYSGEVGRFVYKSATQEKLTITKATSDVIEGTAPLTVSFDGDGTNSNGNTFNVKWHFGDDSSTVATTKKASFTYSKPGTYQPYFEMSSTNGKSVVYSSPLFITVSSSYKPKIVSPVNGTPFKAEDVINIKCNTVGTPDAGVDMVTSVVFKHDDHTHPVTNFVGGVGSFTVPSAGHDVVGDTGFFIKCALRNSKLQEISSDTVFIPPVKIQFQVDTVPSGISVVLENVPATSPIAYGSLKGFRHDIEALDSTCIGGDIYAFSKWSNGGTQTQSIFVSTDLKLVATYVKTGSKCNILPDSAIAFHVSSSVGITATGGKVSQWADQSSLGNDLTPTQTTSPTLVKGGLNGHDYVQFDGVGDGLRNAKSNGLPEGNSDRSMVLVVKYDSTGWGGFTYGNAVCEEVFGLGVTAQVGNLYVEDFCTGDVTFSGVAGTGAGWMIHTIVATKTKATMYKNGKNIDELTLTMNTATSGSICMGMEQSMQNKVKMSVAEAYIFSVALTSEQQVYIEDQLSAKYFGAAASSTTTTTAPTTTTTVGGTPSPVISTPVTKSLALNLDADQLVGTTSNGNVLNWGDLLKKNNLAVIDSNSSPVIKTKGLNGHNYVSFSNQNSAVGKISGVQGMPIVTSKTGMIYMVVRYNSAGYGGFYWSDSGNSCGGAFGLSVTSNYKYGIEDHCRPSPLESTTSAANAGWVVQSVSFKKGRAIMKVGGNAVSNVLYSGSSVASDKIMLGGSNMDVAEVLVYKKSHSAKLEKKILSYLKGKYGV